MTRVSEGHHSGERDWIFYRWPYVKASLHMRSGILRESCLDTLWLCAMTRIAGVPTRLRVSPEKGFLLLRVSSFSLSRSRCILKEVPAETIQGQPAGFRSISPSTCEWGKSETSGLSLRAPRLSFSLMMVYSLVSAKSSLGEWVRGMETMVIQPQLCPLHCKLKWCLPPLAKVPSLQGQGSYEQIPKGNK